MAYQDELSFASGYFQLRYDGTIVISDDMPYDMKIRFWKTWIRLRAKIIDMEMNFKYCSKYPFIPIEDKDPNEWQYKDLLRDDIDYGYQNTSR